jgi:hypothetical protein
MVTRKRDRIPLQRSVAFESEAERFAIFSAGWPVTAGEPCGGRDRPAPTARGNPTHQRPSWTREKAAISSTMEGEFGARLLDGSLTEIVNYFETNSGKEVRWNRELDECLLTTSVES